MGGGVEMAGAGAGREARGARRTTGAVGGAGGRSTGAALGSASAGRVTRGVGVTCAARLRGAAVLAGGLTAAGPGAVGPAVGGLSAGGLGGGFGDGTAAASPRRGAASRRGGATGTAAPLVERTSPLPPAPSATCGAGGTGRERGSDMRLAFTAKRADEAGGAAEARAAGRTGESTLITGEGIAGARTIRGASRSSGEAGVAGACPAGAQRRAGGTAETTPADWADRPEGAPPGSGRAAREASGARPVHRAHSVSGSAVPSPIATAGRQIISLSIQRTIHLRVRPL